jgi:hypothetical protein
MPESIGTAPWYVAGGFGAFHLLTRHHGGLKLLSPTRINGTIHHPTFNFQLSTFNFQLSTFNFQLSTFLFVDQFTQLPFILWEEWIIFRIHLSL